MHGVEMRRGARVLVAVVTVAAFAVVGFAIRSAVGAGAPSVWACQPDQMALDLGTYGQGGGNATAAAGLQSEAAILAAYGVASQSLLDQALASASGATRYDDSNGMLYVGGSVVAQFSAQQLPDQSWGVATTKYCSPPASAGSPGTTDHPMPQQSST